jgi:glutathione S-transferase
MPFVLYGHPESGHSYKVALALSMLELSYEYRVVDVFAPRNERAPDFRAASPFGEIPVLVVDGVPLAQSNAILLHLMRRTRRLGGETEARADQVQQWLFWEANRIGIALGNYRAFVRKEFGDTAAPEVVAWFKERVESSAERLDRELSNRAFLLGDSLSVADLSCSAYLFLAHEAGVDVAAWPGVHRWLDRIASQRGFRPITELMAYCSPKPPTL